MIVEHTPVTILLVQVLANVYIVYIKLPVVSDTLTFIVRTFNSVFVLNS